MTDKKPVSRAKWFFIGFISFWIVSAALNLQPQLSQEQVVERENYIKQAESLIQEGRYEDAQDKLSSAITLENDQHTTEMFAEVREQILLKEALEIPSSNIQENIDIYQRLLKLSPNEDKYRNKLTHYQDKQKLKIREQQKQKLAKQEALLEQKRVANAKAAADKQAAKAQLLRKQEQVVQQYINKFRVSVDKLEANKFLTHHAFPRNREKSSLYAYIGQKTDTGHIWLRLVVQYRSGDWLFVNNYIVYADEKKFSRSPGRFERDHSGGSVWEWSDTNTTREDLEMLRAISDGQNVTVRLQGTQYRSDIQLTSKHKQALRETLELYEALEEKIV